MTRNASCIRRWLPKPSRITIGIGIFRFRTRSVGLWHDFAPRSTTWPTGSSSSRSPVEALTTCNGLHTPTPRTAMKEIILALRMSDGKSVTDQDEYGDVDQIKFDRRGR